MMERFTVNIAPDNAGLIGWLQIMYKTDRPNAMRILRAGWSSITPTQAKAILTGKAELVPTLAANAAAKRVN